MAKQKLKDRDDPNAARKPREKGTAGGQEAGGGHGSGGHRAAKAHGRPAAVDASLPGTRDELMTLHAETRRRRNGAELGSAEHRRAVDLIGRIEVRIAAIERDQVPPLV